MVGANELVATGIPRVIVLGRVVKIAHLCLYFKMDAGQFLNL